jgi:LysR family glycine cleavage system transcriptional activator
MAADPTRFRRDLPPLNSLRAFEATARLGSLLAAADELCVTHGAVSRQVRLLEGWAGIALFERVGRRLLLTEAGRIYRDALGGAFDALAAASGRLRERGRSVQPLTVNALPTFTMRWLLPRLAGFQRRHPDIELRLITADDPIERLAPGGFDVAIRRRLGAWPAGLVAEPFLAEHEIPVCAPALLGRAAIAVPADLAHQTLLHADKRPGAWARWLAAAGVPEIEHAAPRQRFDHFYLALQAAADGLGVALGPLPIIADDLAAGRLVAPLAGPKVPSASYCWIISAGLKDSAPVKAFCAWLSAEGAPAPT